MNKEGKKNPNMHIHVVSLLKEFKDKILIYFVTGPLNTDNNKEGLTAGT